eukprot:4355813-Pleurochrysis_carterae.AAC.2
MASLLPQQQVCRQDSPERSRDGHRVDATHVVTSSNIDDNGSSTAVSSDMTEENRSQHSSPCIRRIQGIRTASFAER